MPCRSSRPPIPVPYEPKTLAVWIACRVREPSLTWKAPPRAVGCLPTPVNLPGMDQAAAAVVSRYRGMPLEWRAEVIQDFMACWLLRPETPWTIAGAALRRLERRKSATIEEAIAWKLRSEIRSRAFAAYERANRTEKLRRYLLDVAGTYEEAVRDNERNEADLVAAR